MQRYTRDRDRDDEGGRSEHGPLARGGDRDTPATRRDEFGNRHASDPNRGTEATNETSETSRAGARASSWRQGNDRDRFEPSYGNAEPMSDYYSGGALTGGMGRDDYEHDPRGSAHVSGGRWQPSGGDYGAMPRRARSAQYGAHQDAPDGAQYGETEYGVYGPRYAGSGSGRSNYGTGGYWGSQRGSSERASHGSQDAYGQRYSRFGEERLDDRSNRQGYGQSWPHGDERDPYHLDSDYRQWRAEQIRNLDDDYQRYREERYRKFADDFDAWRRNREASSGRPAPAGLSGTAATDGGNTGNQSGMGSSAGQTIAGGIGGSMSSSEAGNEASGSGSDPLETPKTSDR